VLEGGLLHILLGNCSCWSFHLSLSPNSPSQQSNSALLHWTPPHQGLGKHGFHVLDSRVWESCECVHIPESPLCSENYAHQPGGDDIIYLLCQQFSDQIPISTWLQSLHLSSLSLNIQDYSNSEWLSASSVIRKLMMHLQDYLVAILLGIPDLYRLQQVILMCHQHR